MFVLSLSTSGYINEHMRLWLELQRCPPAHCSQGTQVSILAKAETF